MKDDRHQAGRRDRDEPADRRDPGAGQPADLRQQPLRPRDQQQGASQKLAQGSRTSRCSTTRSRRTTRPARPTSSWPGTGALADKKITDDDARSRRRATSRSAATRFYDWNHRGFGPCDIYCGFGHSSDTFFFQMAGKLGIDRLGYWAKQYGFGAPTGIDLPGEVAGHRPDEPVEAGRTLGAPIFPGETYQAGIGQGYDVVTPIQLINAYAALANGGTLYQPQVVRDVVGPDGHGRPAVQAEAHPQDEGAGRACCRTMRNAARNTVARAPHLQPRRPADQGRRQVRHGRVRDARQRRAACRSTRGSSGSCPRTPAHGSFNEADSQLVVLAFAYDSRTKGNVGDRDREVLPPAPLRDQEGLPAPEPPRARQLLPEQLMGVIRAEPARVTDWAAKSVGAAWRAFDLQLTTYAGLLARDRPGHGLHEQRRGGTVPLEAGHDVQPRADVGRPSRSSSSSSRPSSTTAG